MSEGQSKGGVGGGRWVGVCEWEKVRCVCDSVKVQGEGGESTPFLIAHFQAHYHQPFLNEYTG